MVTLRFHEVLAMGSIARVYEDGGAEIVSRLGNAVRPHMLKVYRVKKVCDEAVEHVLKLKMTVFGLFTSKRKFVTSKVVLFGTSEIIS